MKIKIAVVVMAVSLAACAGPKKPRMPDDSTRVPINQTVQADMRAAK